MIITSMKQNTNVVITLSKQECFKLLSGGRVASKFFYDKDNYIEIRPEGWKDDS